MEIKKEHLDFIPKIYDTVINPESWPDVLERFAYFCGADISTVFIHDNTYEELTNVASAEKYDPARVQEYIEKHSHEDVAAFSNALRKPVGEWIDDETMWGMPVDEIPGTRFQAEHFNTKHRAVNRLNDTPLWLDAVSLHFTADRGWLTPEEAAIGNMFVPHFAKAVDINRPFTLLKHRFQAILSVLNRFQIGLVVTNSAGEIVISNREAEAFLSARNGIGASRSNHLQASPEPFNQNLLGMIQAASAPEQNPNFVSTMTVPKRDDTQDWLLDVQPLADIHGNIDGYFQGAMIFITDPDRDEVISTVGMQKLFNLTDAESDICALLTTGHKAKDVADSRNVSIGTVRNQIQSVFDKTQTNSQLDLVRLALKVNLPVETPS